MTAYNLEDHHLTVEELPTWMRPSLPKNDWAVWAVFFLCLVAMIPLFRNEGLPSTLQAELETYRIVSVADNLPSGHLYPRWSSEFNYGYGSPLFNYLAPFPHYAGGMHLAITDEPPHVSLKWMIGMALTIGGISTFAFVQRLWGSAGGIFAAAVFLFSPYMSLTAPFLMTDMGVLYAISFFPTFLWAIDRALIHGRGRDLLILAIVGAVLLLCDNSLSPLLFALGIGWIVWLRLATPQYYWRLTVFGLILGIALASFYLLPAYAEWDEVRWQSYLTYPYAVDSSTLFEFLPPTDRSAFNPSPTMHVGIGIWTLTLVGSAILIAESARRFLPRQRALLPQKPTPETTLNSHSLYATFYFLVLLFPLCSLALSPHHPIWTSQDQFEDLRPIDLIGIITFSSACLSGQIIVALECYLHNFWRRLIALLILLIIFVPATANVFYTPSFVAVRDIRQQQVQTEQRGHALGTITNGQLLPRSVQTLPDLNELAISTSGGERQDKIDRRDLPPNIRISIQNQSPTTDSFVIESPIEQELTILTFYFPGWHAERNNTTIPVTAIPPYGLIQLPLQDGNNEIILHFQDTQIRWWSWVISGTSLLIAIFSGYWLERLHHEKGLRPYLSPLAARRLRERKQLAIITVICLSVTVYFIRLNPSWVTTTTERGATPSGVTRYPLIVDGGIGFQGFAFEPSVIRGNTQFILKTYWVANPDRPNLPDYQIRIRLQNRVDPTKTFEKRYRHLSTWPTNQWTLAGYIVADYDLDIPSDLPSGEYEIYLIIESCNRVDLIPCEDTLPRPVTDLRRYYPYILLPEYLRIE